MDTRDRVFAIWEVDHRRLPVLAVAAHAGHDLRPEVAARIALSDERRLYEEDPGTDVLARVAPVRGIARGSRFEVDLNRIRSRAVYLDPGDAWGLELWREPPGPEIVRRSLARYDAFHRRLAHEVALLVRKHGFAVVLDCHSYNHRRGGPATPPEDPRDNPEVNVGTGSLDRELWGDVVDRFIHDMSDRGFDTRENVRFQGREIAAAVHRTFPEVACCLALEFKKTYMDEHRGTIDGSELERRAEALGATLDGLVEEAGAARRRRRTAS